MKSLFMKKNLLILILLFGFCSVFQAQNQRYFYQYKKKNIDSTGKDISYKETFILDVSQKGSRFWSYEALESDSIKKSELKDYELGKYEAKWFRGSRFFIDKKYPGFKINHISSISVNVFNLEDDRKPKWEILKQTDKIFNFKVQKAEAQFMGRKWIAWFTEDIPIQDGPHKFFGLPGLILKVEDESEIYSFEIAGIKKLDKLDLDIYPFYDSSSMIVKVNYQKYKKVYSDYYFKGIFVMPQSDENTTFVDSNGKKISKEEFYRPIINSVKNSASKKKELPMDLELAN